jgi:hypothetical protein
MAALGFRGVYYGWGENSTSLSNAHKIEALMVCLPPPLHSPHDSIDCLGED